jgi:drug/metabolite transporter (DMT)-like permease
MITCHVVAPSRRIDIIALAWTAVKEPAMRERFGVGIAILSSAVGGGAAVATRYLVTSADPFTLAAIRFGGGVLCLLPVALLLQVRWPAGRKDRLLVAGLGLLFFAVFFVFYNLALAFTTVARGTLALSTLPLMTMLVGALLRIEALSTRKSVGVALAMSGVAAALVSGLAKTVPGAWRGDLIMIGATFCMALYNVWSRPFIARSSTLFLTAGMLAGAAVLVPISLLSGDIARVAAFTTSQWAAALYLAAGGGALAFFLWVLALQHASPTRVANTMTVNPIVAGLLAAGLLGEPLTLNLVIGLIAVFAGLWIATTEGAGLR